MRRQSQTAVGGFSHGKDSLEPGSAATRAAVGLRGALLLLLLLVLEQPLRAQTTVLFEGFEGNFPADNGWSVGDDNPSGTPAFWDDVNSTFGGAGTHSGGWKGYCAGSTYPFNSSEPNPVYQNDMTAFMQRSVDLTGFVSAQLSFWYIIPSIETCCDRARVLIDGSEVWSAGSAVSAC